MIRIVLLGITAICFIIGMSGCTPIMQWQRQYLGDPIMQFTPDPHEQQLKDHIYPRREGSSGGTGSAGGGCGC